MNIYVYGNQSFKKDIYKILDNSRFKKLHEDVIIEEINNLSDLEETIKARPKDIYLIDDEKIIKKKSIKPKMFIPKDGIAEQFLIDYGVTDLTISSLDEIPDYIIKKYELERNLENIKELENLQKNQVEQEKQEEFDTKLPEVIKEDEKEEEKLEDVSENISSEPENNINGIDLDELENLIEVPKEEDKEIKSDKTDAKMDELEDFNNDFGLNNISFDYDDKNILNENSSLNEDVLSDINSVDDVDNTGTSTEKLEDVNFLDEIFEKQDDKNEFFDTLEEPKVEEKEETIEEKKTQETENFSEALDNFDDQILNDDKKIDKEDMDLKIYDKDLQNQDDEVIDPTKSIINTEKNEVPNDFKGEKMSDEFSELDDLNEQDIMEALNYNVSDTPIQKAKTEASQTTVTSKKEESIVLDNANADEISHLISKLLSNKTLEITIKVKD